MKFHAYVGQAGMTRKSAYQVRAERNDIYRGGPSPEKFFSLHREGSRKPMEHVIGPGRPFFRFSEARDEGSSGGPGESIEHWLFKEAVASLSRTRISFGGQDHRITITHGETEKLLPGTSCAYRSDVYLRFQAEDPSELGLKWSGELYIEIHRANLVESKKHDEVRALELPMIEVDIPLQLMYRHGGAGTTDALEQTYIQWLRAVLESDKGFLKSVTLSDPSSKAYLSKKFNELKAVVDQQGQQLKKTADDLKRRQQEVEDSNQLIAAQKQKNEALIAELEVERRRAVGKTDAARALADELRVERAAKATIETRVQVLGRAAIGLASFAAMLLAAFLFQTFFATVSG